MAYHPPQTLGPPRCRPGQYRDSSAAYHNPRHITKVDPIIDVQISPHVSENIRTVDIDADTDTDRCAHVVLTRHIGAKPTLSHTQVRFALIKHLWASKSDDNRWRAIRDLQKLVDDAHRIGWV